MLTQDNLKKIGELVDKIVNSRLKPVKKDIQDLNIKVSSFDTKIGSIDKRIDSLDTKISKLDITLDKLSVETSDVHSFIFDKYENHEQRIKRIEDNLDLGHS